VIWIFRHRLSWDLTGIADREQRAIVQGALNACAFPFSRVRKRTGKRVPCSVADLSRYAEALAAAGGSHVHVHDEEGNEAHLLGAPPDVVDPSPVRAHDGVEHAPAARAAALGLYWLPTLKYPAGRVELERTIFRDPALAREVFLAEAAHAVDYGALVDGQRAQIVALFDWKGSGSPAAGWFEEQGEEVYWRWRGERWMGLFMATYAPSLPRPLEPRQPWQWAYDATDVGRVKTILR
jgi:hypothetical protein